MIDNRKKKIIKKEINLVENRFAINISFFSRTYRKHPICYPKLRMMLMIWVNLLLEIRVSRHKEKSKKKKNSITRCITLLVFSVTNSNHFIWYNCVIFVLVYLQRCEYFYSLFELVTDFNELKIVFFFIGVYRFNINLMYTLFYHIIA